MGYQEIILFVVGTLNAFFSYFILRGEKKVANYMFFLIALSVSLWSFNLGFFTITKNLDLALIFANSYYIAAAAIPIFFLYFSLFFPENKKRFKKKHLFFLIPFSILIGLTLLDKNIILKEIYFTSWGKDVVLDKVYYIAYVSYFIFFVTVSYYYLIKLYTFNLSITEKIQLKFLIIGTTLSYTFGMIFNLFFPYFGNYHYIWFGPFFTLIMIFSLGYAILKHHLFNIKTIATEILTFSLWVFILTRTLIATNTDDKLINGALLLVTIVVGVLLIRSVYREVETREKIQKLAEELAKANEQLQILDKQKSEFVSIASHQLRSPLTAIRGYTSMLMEGSYGDIPVKAMEAIDRVSQSSQHLVALVEDLLNVSRIESGKMSYNFISIDLEKITEDIIGALLPNIQKNKLDFTFETDKKGPYMISADSEKIRQVILNLIDNSMKYTPSGFIRAHLSRDESAGRILLTVQDSGIGVSPELKERLFEKFSRGDDKTRLHVNGTGLGLYVAKEIIKAHKGNIWVESPGEGKGSTFFVEFMTEDESGRIESIKKEEIEHGKKIDEFAKTL